MKRLDADLGDTPDRDEVEDFITRAYDSDLSAASSIDESAGALQEIFGFGPATARWEAYSQARGGASMLLRVPDGTDFDVLADNLRSAGYKAPEEDSGVWNGGPDLVSGLDPTISPELQYVVLLEDSSLVVTSDRAGYLRKAADAASGDRASVDEKEGVSALADRIGTPAAALVWADDFACEDLAMSQADDEDQSRAEELVREAGGVTPLKGLAMAMEPDRTLRVVAHFEDGDSAEENLRPRARLAVGEAVGRGGSFADDFELTRSRALGSEVVLDFEPRSESGFVLSALYDGPVLFATC